MTDLLKRIDEVLDATFKYIPVDTRDLLEDCRAEIELLSQVNESLRNQNTALDEILADYSERKYVPMTEYEREQYGIEKYQENAIITHAGLEIKHD